MQGLALSDSGSNIPQSGTMIDLPSSSESLYTIVQQEVDLGVQALQREGADMAVTLFQSALQKLSIDQPFYDHLVHNLLLSYELLIKQLLKRGDTSTAQDFLRAALRLEIRGKMAEDSTFLRKFAGAFQGLGLVFSKTVSTKKALCAAEKRSRSIPVPALTSI
jgi:hypothetical protein